MSRKKATNNCKGYFPRVAFGFLLLMGCQLLCLSFGAAARQPLNLYSNSQFVRVNGIAVHYRHWEPTHDMQKPWVFMVHGFAASTYSWHKTVEPLLESGFHVVAVDVPPYGFSEKTHRINGSPDAQAQMLWHVASAINPHTQWNLMGHSMGGGIVQAMAILQPERVFKVVFVAPSLFTRLKPEPRSIQQHLLGLWPVEVSLATIGRVLLINPRRVGKLIRSAYGSQPAPADVDAYYKTLALKGTARGIIGSNARRRVHTEMGIDNFRSDALAIWGEKDTWVPHSRMERITEKMETMAVVIIKGQGHNPMETEPELFNRVLLQFLNE